MGNDVIAVVVTFNRLNLLKEAIAALKGQTVAIAKIVVVDNGSTDGTDLWLNTQTDLLVKKQANSGGAGGFSTGIELATGLDAGWVWLMDDDTICSPDALAQLLEKKNALPQQNIGFIGSKPVWNDGEPHLMNIVNIKPYFHTNLPFNTFDSHDLLLTESCSFVSVLININAVKQVGLPYKEFFIWGDDLEYTERITKAGFLGFYCAQSVVHHKTPTNYRPDFYKEPPQQIWKYRYGFRNELFLIKRDKGILFYAFWLIAKVGYTSLKILARRKDHKLAFIKAVVSAGWNSIFFNPKMRKV